MFYITPMDTYGTLPTCDTLLSSTVSIQTLPFLKKFLVAAQYIAFMFPQLDHNEQFKKPLHVRMIFSENLRETAPSETAIKLRPQILVPAFPVPRPTAAVDTQGHCQRDRPLLVCAGSTAGAAQQGTSGEAESRASGTEQGDSERSWGRATPGSHQESRQERRAQTKLEAARFRFWVENQENEVVLGERGASVRDGVHQTYRRGEERNLKVWNELRSREDKARQVRWEYILK